MWNGLLQIRIDLLIDAWNKRKKKFKENGNKTFAISVGIVVEVLLSFGFMCYLVDLKNSRISLFQIWGSTKTNLSHTSLSKDSIHYPRLPANIKLENFQKYCIVIELNTNATGLWFSLDQGHTCILLKDRHWRVNYVEKFKFYYFD